MSNKRQVVLAKDHIINVHRTESKAPQIINLGTTQR